MSFPTFDELLDIDYTDSKWYDLTNLPNEQWKDIKDYEGLYQVSNYGRVKSLKKKLEITNKYGTFYFWRYSKILKPIVGNTGYLVVSLVKEKRKKQFRVHQLVGRHFLANPNNYNCINHINGIKYCNLYTNLEYCTYSHNNKEAYRLGLKKPSKTMLGKLDKDCPNSVAVNQYDLDGIFIKRWNSSREAMRQLNMKSNKIYMCCQGKRHTYAGYKWSYADE